MTPRTSALADSRGTWTFWLPAVAIVAVDVITKYAVHGGLGAKYLPRDVLGDVLRLTRAYNPGAAFGFHLGSYSRWIFTSIAVLALFVVWDLHRKTPGDRGRALALGLIAGGAAGNLVNRLWSARGVVDFIDVGLGTLRWPAFNVADIGITIGAVLLAWVFWREDRRDEERRRSGGGPH